MRHTPTQAVIPSSILSKNFLQSISPSQSASPSVAHYSAGLAHDARNMLAAMDIYCELLASPGVLKPDDRHLLDELRLLRDSSGKLLDRLLVEALKCLASSDQVATRPRSMAASLAPALIESPDQISDRTGDRARTAVPSAVIFDPADSYLPDLRDRAAAQQSSSVAAVPASEATASTTTPAFPPAKRVTDLAAQLQSMLPMLSALAGPRVHVSATLETCPDGELFMPSVDLTRVLINLVRNAAEAMSIGGRILIAATAVSTPITIGGNDGIDGSIDSAPAVLLSIEDNGPGIPLSLLDRIFDLQVSSATQEESTRPRMQFRPRGLGLRIVREFVEASGGSVRALRLPDRGSRFEIVLPMVTVKVTQVARQM